MEKQVAKEEAGLNRNLLKKWKVSEILFVKVESFLSGFGAGMN